MRLLLDNEGVKIWPHPLSAHLSTQAQGQQVINSVILENSSRIVHGSTVGSHHWQKTGKIAILFGKTCFEVKIKSPTPSQ